MLEYLSPHASESLISVIKYKFKGFLTGQQRYNVKNLLIMTKKDFKNKKLHSQDQCKSLNTYLCITYMT